MIDWKIWRLELPELKDLFKINVRSRTQDKFLQRIFMRKTSAPQLRAWPYTAQWTYWICINPDVKEELYHLKTKSLAFNLVSYKYWNLKEVFDCLELKWDWTQLDQIQTWAILKKERELEEKIKQLNTFVAEYDKYQASLAKLKALIYNQKRAEPVLTMPNTPPEQSAQCSNFNQRELGKPRSLYHEIIKKLRK